MIARIDPALGVNAGDTLRLGLDSARMHLFAADSGEHLPAGDTD